jgi:acyl-homoserine-lactone acylase
MDLNALFEMKTENYLDVGVLLSNIKNWDRITAPESFGAGAYAVLYYQLRLYYLKLDADHLFTQPILH